MMLSHSIHHDPARGQRCLSDTLIGAIAALALAVAFVFATPKTGPVADHIAYAMMADGNQLVAP